MGVVFERLEPVRGQEILGFGLQNRFPIYLLEASEV